MYGVGEAVDRVGQAGCQIGERHLCEVGGVLDRHIPGFIRNPF